MKKQLLRMGAAVVCMAILMMPMATATATTPKGYVYDPTTEELQAYRNSPEEVPHLFL